MITPRRFTIMNGNGNELDLLTYELFLNEPEGLGYKRDDEYRRIGNRWVLVNTHLSQDPISGKLCFFTEDPYAKYFHFIKFTQIPPLTLIYKPNPLTSIAYRRAIRITKLEKSEVNKDGYLECPIELTPLAPWYKIVEDHDGSKWNWQWIYDTTEDSIQWWDGVDSIESDSVMDSPCRLIIYGPATNPSWQHKVDGLLYETGKVNVTLADGEMLIVDDTMDPYTIGVYDVSTKALKRNVYQNSDFNTQRFIRLQFGTNTVTVTSDDADDDSQLISELEGMIYYESV